MLTRDNILETLFPISQRRRSDGRMPFEHAKLELKRRDPQAYTTAQAQGVRREQGIIKPL